MKKIALTVIIIIAGITAVTFIYENGKRSGYTEASTACQYGQLEVSNSTGKVMAVAIDNSEIGIVNIGEVKIFNIATGGREFKAYNPNANYMLSRKIKRNFYMNCNEMYSINLQW